MTLAIDLFITKEQALEDWMKTRGFFSTHSVIKWGCDNFYNRANRTKQQLESDGVIRMLSKDEKVLRGFTCKDAVYEWIGHKELAGCEG